MSSYVLEMSMMNGRLTKPQVFKKRKHFTRTSLLLDLAEFKQNAQELQIMGSSNVVTIYSKRADNTLVTTTIISDETTSSQSRVFFKIKYPGRDTYPVTWDEVDSFIDNEFGDWGVA